jgi:hypothetical protein
LLTFAASLAALAVSPVCAARLGALSGPLSGFIASACRDKGGRLSVVVLDEKTLEVVASLELPERGHGMAARPRSDEAPPRELVTFARRPGTFAVVQTIDGSREPIWLASRPDRRFFGHGLFSNDGRLLYSTEDDFENERGVIGVRDATDGYRQIGELPSGGIEPHELALLSDGRTLVVANGGIPTDPDQPRLERTSDMRPSLALVDSETGDVLERHEPPGELHKLSIRHLCVCHGDRVIIGCQYRGAAQDIRSNAGLFKRGAGLSWLAMPDGLDFRIRNYIGSVTAARGGTAAVVTAPRGGLAIWIDPDAGRYLTHYDMDGAYGACGRQDDVVLTGEDGHIVSVGGENWKEGNTLPQKLVGAWDNHLLRFG